MIVVQKKKFARKGIVNKRAELFQFVDFFFVNLP
jgi:hypothetical protein